MRQLRSALTPRPPGGLESRRARRLNWKAWNGDFPAVMGAGGCGLLLITILASCSNNLHYDELSCDWSTASVLFEYEHSGGSGTFCAAGSLAYWLYSEEPEKARADSWAHALKRSDNRWILVVAYAPTEPGDVNRVVLLLPARQFGITHADGTWAQSLWRGPYNLGCTSSSDHAADDCWGLEELGFCLASADPEEQARLPDCLAGWPRGTAIIHRVGYVAVSGPSDEEYAFDFGELSLEADVSSSGHRLNGTFHGSMGAVAGTDSSRRLSITNGRFQLVVTDSPFWF